jgi:hypothetical protein
MTILETDASDFALGAILSQKHPDDDYPVAYFSRKLTVSEINYGIFSKELLAIVAAFSHWRHFSVGVSRDVNRVE